MPGMVADGVTGSEDLFDKFWIAFQKCADDEERCWSLMFRKSFQNSRCISIFITGIESKVDYLFAGVLCVKGIKFFNSSNVALPTGGSPSVWKLSPQLPSEEVGTAAGKK